jgi:MEMO1 family protein
MTVRSPGHHGSVREAAVASRFYPANARQLATTVDGLLAASAAPAPDAPAPVALIVPHAG